MTSLESIQTLFSKAGIQLRPHQEDGIRWMLELESKGTGGLLADDPGLGKTFQALALATTGKNLLVVPTSILGQWREAAVRLFGDDQVLVYHGPKRKAATMRSTRIVITTYGLLRSDVTLLRPKWNRVILDEIHTIKSSKSKTSKSAMMLRARFRWGLSGTPVQNKTSETANLFRFILGGVSKIDVPLLLRTHTLRRLKETVLGDSLPSLDIKTQPVEFMREDERRFYEGLEKNCHDAFQKILGAESRMDNLVMFELLLRLRQASQHPQLVLNGFGRKFGHPPSVWNHTSSKHAGLLRLMQQHPDFDSLVFCQFTEEMNILQKLLKEKGYEVLRLDGGMSSDARERNLSAAQTLRDPCSSDKPRVFLIQIVAGGVGLNLQAFSRVYIMSPDWNPCNEIQAIARAHRMGQVHDVHVTRIVLQSENDNDNDNDNEPTTRSLIDDRILNVQAQKRLRMAQLLRDDSLRSNGKLLQSLSRNDFLKLL